MYVLARNKLGDLLTAVVVASRAVCREAFAEFADKNAQTRKKLGDMNADTLKEVQQLGQNILTLRQGGKP